MRSGIRGLLKYTKPDVVFIYMNNVGNVFFFFFFFFLPLCLCLVLCPFSFVLLVASRKTSPTQVQ